MIIIQKRMKWIFVPSPTDYPPNIYFRIHEQNYTMSIYFFLQGTECLLFFSSSFSFYNSKHNVLLSSFHKYLAEACASANPMVRAHACAGSDRCRHNAAMASGDMPLR